MSKNEAKIEEKKIDEKIWRRKENIAKYISYGIIAGMVAILFIVTYAVNS